MGHIWMPSEGFVRSLSEDAGCRSGFALEESDILEGLGYDHQFVEQVTARKFIRLASTDYADAVGDMLFKLGAARTSGMPPLSSRILWHIGLEPGDGFDIMQLIKIEAVAREYARRKISPHEDQDEIVEELKQLLLNNDATWFTKLLVAVDEEISMNPFYVREAGTSAPITIKDLFHSEKLPASDECFFDQRFVDYLDRNPGELLKMHWRQFEALTAEWFQRQGYTVELGPGRNDGGVDLRMWKDDLSVSGPPTVIVQCKRYKDKVDRVTVKALYSDLLFEQATGGMLVTTSDISRGAKLDIRAREYPITTANRETVATWLSKMRTPGSGFLNFDDPPTL